ncbi:hypothetical protein Tco_0476385 [Tanacetum coccineum]
MITAVIFVQFWAVSSKVALSSTLKATIALLIIVVVVTVVVVVVVVVVVFGRPDSTVLGRMANPFAVSAPSIGLACVLPLILLLLVWIVHGEDHHTFFLSCLDVSIGDGSYPPSTSVVKSNHFLHGLRLFDAFTTAIQYHIGHLYEIPFNLCAAHGHAIPNSACCAQPWQHETPYSIKALKVVVSPGSVVTTGSVVISPGSVVTTGSVVVPPGSVVTTGSILLLEDYKILLVAIFDQEISKGKGVCRGNSKGDKGTKKEREQGFNGYVSWFPLMGIIP